MSERELLELAAKAARYSVRGIAAQMVSYLPANAIHLVIGNDRGGDSVWNPLANDGDALRLAVDLELDIFFNDGDTDVLNVSEGGGDPYVRTRRAIVRAAAEIGRAIPAAPHDTLKGEK